MRAIVVVEEGEMSAPAATPKQGKCCEYTLDGSVDMKGRPAVKGKSGGWLAGALILGIILLTTFPALVFSMKNKIKQRDLQLTNFLPHKNQPAPKDN
jgi:hypothetical protein